jgi:hypothetical protein
MKKLEKLEKLKSKWNETSTSTSTPTSTIDSKPVLNESSEQVSTDSTLTGEDVTDEEMNNLDDDYEDVESESAYTYSTESDVNDESNDLPRFHNMFVTRSNWNPPPISTPYNELITQYHTYIKQKSHRNVLMYIDTILKHSDCTLAQWKLCLQYLSQHKSILEMKVYLMLFETTGKQWDEVHI